MFAPDAFFLLPDAAKRAYAGLKRLKKNNKQEEETPATRDINAAHLSLPLVLFAKGQPFSEPASQ